MNLSRVHPGSVVRCDVLGRVFTALVIGKPAAGEVEIDPPKGVTYRRLKARQVTEVLAPATPSGQMAMTIGREGS